MPKFYCFNGIMKADILATHKVQMTRISNPSLIYTKALRTFAVSRINLIFTPDGIPLRGIPQKSVLSKENANRKALKQAWRFPICIHDVDRLSRWLPVSKQPAAVFPDIGGICKSNKT